MGVPGGYQLSVGTDRTCSMDESASLSWLLDHTLPLNRKERFYTGTVLPALVCADFEQLHRLTTLMGHPEVVQASGDPVDPGVVFFTEYGVAESVYGPSAERFAGLPTARDTPDVVFLTLRPAPALFALEAKMYDRPGGASLRAQMDLQRSLLDSLAEQLAEQLAVDRVPVVHRALLPDRLAETLHLTPHEVITWEQVRGAYADVAPAYWLQMLTEALVRYPDLVTRAMPNDDDRLSGQDILDGYRAGTLPYTAVGRSQGLGGLPLEEDISTGAWRSTQYQVAVSHPGNRNWFPVEEFVERIQRQAPDAGERLADRSGTHEEAVDKLRAALGDSSMIGTRVFGNGSVAETIMEAPVETFRTVPIEELHRVAELYRQAAESARIAREGASWLHGHVSHVPDNRR